MLVMQSVVVDQVLGPGIRVTVAMGTDHDLGTDNLYFLSSYHMHICFLSLNFYLDHLYTFL